MNDRKPFVEGKGEKVKFTYTVSGMMIVLTLVLSGCGAETTSNESVKVVTPNTTVATKAQPVEAVAEATRLLQKNEYTAAIAKADEILKIYPNSDEAYSIKGMAMGLNGAAQGGLEFTKKAYKINPNNVSNYYNMAMLYKLEGNLQEAKNWFEKVLAKDPRNTWSVYGIATIYADQGNDEKALEWLKQAISIDPVVKDVARTQDHFVRFHGNPTFDALVK
ncbi:TPR repeat-containing protein yrrB [Veillonella criceti]|uniref:TPR repeat-containing protein yrrB n=1 Tax=Veillonella criceti TaxID=103891 RepID=A0A380NMC4_9FIRM|nr:TPR repeat-containing protein yrrB [Veillonella criceti]